MKKQFIVQSPQSPDCQDIKNQLFKYNFEFERIENRVAFFHQKICYPLFLKKQVNVDSGFTYVRSVHFFETKMKNTLLVLIVLLNTSSIILACSWSPPPRIGLPENQCGKCLDCPPKGLEHIYNPIMTPGSTLEKVLLQGKEDNFHDSK